MDSIECSINSYPGSRQEIDPDGIINSTFKTIKNCMDMSGIKKSQLSGIGMSCQMHSLMVVDANCKPLTKLLIWADTRASKEAYYIKENFNVQELYYKTGCRVQHPMYPLSKILWFKYHEPEIFRKAHKFITIKEYLIYKLYNEYIVDFTLAASQGYFNINTQQWDDEILNKILGISKDKLSEVVECTHVLKGFNPEYESIMGISKDTPMVIGSGDGIMANIGCGVCDDTAFSCTVGTSGAIRTAVNSPIFDPNQQTWCYSFTKDMWVAGGAINNGGLVLNWLKEVFNKQFEYDAAANDESIFELFNRFVKEVKPGSDGLIFLPYLTGERSPDWKAEVRGLMFGLDYSHTRKHIVRSAMEGVMYRMYSVYNVLSNLSCNASQIRANGGYTKSEVWLQMQADIFNKEILVSKVNEASALGAAYIAMAALGEVNSIKQLLPGMAPIKAILPSKENHEIYQETYTKAMQIYQKIYN